MHAWLFSGSSAIGFLISGINQQTEQKTMQAVQFARQPRDGTGLGISGRTRLGVVIAEVEAAYPADAEFKDEQSPDDEPIGGRLAGIGQAITFVGCERFSHVLIRHLPEPNSCVLGVGTRRHCVIQLDVDIRTLIETKVFRRGIRAFSVM